MPAVPHGGAFPPRYKKAETVLNKGTLMPSSRLLWGTSALIGIGWSGSSTAKQQLSRMGMLWIAQIYRSPII